MTQAEIAFFRRRLREELRSANTLADPTEREVHLQWAQYFAGRLEGRRVAQPAVPYAGPVSIKDLAA
jgi:hypothetical protein